MHVKRILGFAAFLLTLLMASSLQASAQSNWQLQGRGKVGNVVFSVAGGCFDVRGLNGPSKMDLFSLTLQDATTGAEIGFANDPAVADFSKGVFHNKSWSKWETGRVAFTTTLHLSEELGGGDTPVTFTYINDGAHLPSVQIDYSVGSRSRRAAGIPQDVTINGATYGGYIALNVW